MMNKSNRSMVGRATARGLFTTALAALLATGTMAGTAQAASCLATQAGDTGLTCGASDFAVTSIIIDNLIDGCTGIGDTFQFNGRFGIASGSPNRYDIGLYVSGDGEQAYTGNQCTVSILPNTSPFPNLDGDGCRDYNGTAQLVPVSNVTTKCVDTDKDGFYDVAVCTSWDNNQMPDCSSVSQLEPATRSKCACYNIDTNIRAPRCGTNADCPSDGNVCTTEVCTPPGTTNADDFGCRSDNNTVSCDDGLFCTVSDTCSNGTCGGTPRACTDNNVCTNDSCNETTDACVFTNNTATCNDGQYCTVNDTCSNGTCNGAPRNCNDNNVCTNDSCSEAADQCVNAANTLPCNDGLYCNGTDVCANGTCGHSGNPCPGSDGDADCSETCNEAADNCESNDANGTVCNDGQFCTTGDTCQAGVCTSTPRNCGDGNGCTTDSCDEAGDACVNANNTNPCSDGLFCTSNDTCSAGQCRGTATDCDDDNFCTTDSCDENANACVNANNANPCDDGLFCTSNDACSGGQCRGSATNCDDENVCTDDSCDENANACSNVPDNTNPCDDGLFCTAGDACVAGVCRTSARDCDDQNACTDDSCDENANACANAPDDTNPCDDGLFCTSADACVAGQCRASATDCDDENACTDDSCDEIANQCDHEADDTNPCDDGLYCTVEDACVSGLCTGPARDCGDKNVCTDDSCDDTQDACVNSNNTGACDDGLYCTTGDACSGGSCVASGVRDCDDDNVCTDDACDEGEDECANVPDDTNSCDDGLYCTGVEGCVSGDCEATGNPCDGADGDADCSETCDEAADNCDGNDPNNSACDDGLFCTVGDKCTAGVCSTTPRNCNDQNVCTADSCDDVADTCDNDPLPDGTACEDGQICTIEDICEQGQCVGLESALFDLCPWIIVQRAGPKRDTLKIRSRDLIGNDVMDEYLGGDVCGGTIKVGNQTTILGDIVSGLAFGSKAMRLSPDTFIEEDIVTDGAGARAKPGVAKLPHLAAPTSSLAGGSLTPKSAPAGFYDLTGNHPLSNECVSARTDAYVNAVTILDGIGPTQTFQRVRLKRFGAITINTSNPGGIEMVDIGLLKTGRNATITLDGGGNPATAMVLRVGKKFAIGLQSSVVLTGGLTPENVLYYVKGKKCAIGNLTTGGGTLFCANGRMKTGRGVVWSGTFYGAGNVSKIGDTNILTYAPFLGF